MALTRIVKMTFLPEKMEEFKTVFRQSEDKIRTFPGCLHMEAFRSESDPFTVFTYSIWESPQSLENYRNSSLFKSVWAKTKACFREPAEAWSLQSLD